MKCFEIFSSFTFLLFLLKLFFLPGRAGRFRKGRDCLA
jgi:hypothetical protein